MVILIDTESVLTAVLYQLNAEWYSGVRENVIHV